MSSFPIHVSLATTSNNGCKTSTNTSWYDSSIKMCLSKIHKLSKNSLEGEKGNVFNVNQIMKTWKWNKKKHWKMKDENDM